MGLTPSGKKVVGFEIALNSEKLFASSSIAGPYFPIY